MPTIAKVPHANGVAWKAIIKRRGAILKTKTFTTKTAARAWARRIEADAEMMEAMGEEGARLLLKDLCSEYLEQWNGRAHSRIYQVNWWVDELGNQYVNDLTPEQIRDALNRYRSGRSLVRVGSDVAGRSILSYRLTWPESWRYGYAIIRACASASRESGGADCHIRRAILPGTARGDD